jgi:hypothetical protein
MAKKIEVVNIGTFWIAVWLAFIFFSVQNIQTTLHRELDRANDIEYKKLEAYCVAEQLENCDI